MEWWKSLDSVKRSATALFAALCLGMAMGGSLAAALVIPDRVEAVEEEQELMRVEHRELRQDINTLVRSMGRLTCVLAARENGTSDLAC